MRDWNAILDSKIDKVGRGAGRSVGCESSLIDCMAKFDLVDTFHLNHPEEMWTWSNLVAAHLIKTYLDQVLI